MEIWKFFYGNFRYFLSKFLAKISIFDQNFDFKPKLLAKSSIFDQNFDFKPKFRIFNQTCDFTPKFRLVAKILIDGQNLEYLIKLAILELNFYW